MTTFTHLTAYKGGQGTSTIAVLLANAFINANKRVLIVQGADGDIDALCATSTLSDGVAIRVNDNLTIAQAPVPTSLTSQFDAVISDNTSLGDEHDDTNGQTYLVTQPCYMALRKFTLADNSFTQRLNGVIIVRPIGARVLTDRDIQGVTNLPIVASITMDNDVARASDAGLLLRGGKHSLGISELTDEKHYID